MIQRYDTVNYPPSYLIKNRYGIFYFQYRIPADLLKYSNGKKLVRVSLRTRIRRDALNHARMLRLIMDKLAKQFFNSAESFGKGMALLMQYNEMQPCDWDTMQSFIENLDEAEDHYLDSAIKYSSAQSLETKSIQEENLLLKKTIELLHNKASDKSLTFVESLPSDPQEITPSLSELVEKYKVDCEIRWSEKNINVNSKDLFPKLDLFLEVIGDKPVTAIKKEDISTYKHLIFKYPVNKNKKPAYKNLSISEILDLDLPAKDKLSNVSIGNHFTKIRTFITWCEDNCSFMPHDLSKALGKSPKNTIPDDEQRDPFTDNDLIKLFGSKEYIQGTHSAPSHFWVPLLGLFTGARENELCQLDTSDIYQDKTTGIWVIDINEKGNNKRLKKPFHKRIVPVHKKLIELGFTTFVESIKTEKLFPDLPFNRDGYGQNFSKWFNRTYRNKRHCNVGLLPDEKKNFHSFRHTVITQLQNVHNISEPKTAKLVGQTSTSKSVTTKRYTSPLGISENQNIINKLSFPIDFKKIRRFK